MIGSDTFTEFRVRYAETDQMGVAHHANYLIWCELGRTQHMQHLGLNYGELERAGVFLPVVRANLRFKAAARYDDVLRVRCWVRASSRRHVEFGNAIERPVDEKLLATAVIGLLAVDSDHVPTTLPDAVRSLLVPAPDPVRL